MRDISGKTSRGHCRRIGKYCTAAECSFAVIKAEGQLAISDGERGIREGKTTQIIYCWCLGLDHAEPGVFKGCLIASWGGLGCQLPDLSFFVSLSLEMHCL